MKFTGVFNVQAPMGNKLKEKMSEGLRMCNDILKELFAKKHSVSKLLSGLIQPCVLNLISHFKTVSLAAPVGICLAILSTC